MRIVPIVIFFILGLLLGLLLAKLLTVKKPVGVFTLDTYTGLCQINFYSNEDMEKVNKSKVIFFDVDSKATIDIEESYDKAVKDIS